MTTASYRTGSGFEISGGLVLTQTRPTHSFFGGIQFNRQNQNTTITTNDDYTSLGVIFGIKFDVGEHHP